MSTVGSTATTTAAGTPGDAATAIPKAQFDWLPMALVPLLALAAWPFIGSSSTWRWA